MATVVDVSFPPRRPDGGREPGPVQFGTQQPWARPTVLERVEAEYPEAARQAGIRGTVLATLEIDELGAVARVGSVQGPPELIDAAVTALRQWRYQPGAPGSTRAVIRIPQPVIQRKSAAARVGAPVLDSSPELAPPQPPAPPAPPVAAVPADELAPAGNAKSGDADTMKDRAFDAAMQRNRAEAEKWYGKAFAAGDLYSCEKAGDLFITPELGPLDPRRAIDWWSRCAATGSVSAMRSLGGLYLRPRPELVFIKNVDEGLRWYAKAAAAGDEFSRRMINDSVRTREFWTCANRRHP